jgi:hypothetical protein
MTIGPIARFVGAAILPTLVVVAVVVSSKRRRSSLSRGESHTTTDERGLEILSRRALRSFLESGGDPRQVSLRSARLDGLDLSGRNLKRVDLSKASLRRSSLSRARLERARLDYVDLTDADLRSADLAGASLLDANLWRADLRGADLSDCGSAGMANLRRARFDRTTRWPPGFDPVLAGAVEVARGAR